MSDQVTFERFETTDPATAKQREMDRFLMSHMPMTETQKTRFLQLVRQFSAEVAAEQETPEDSLPDPVQLQRS
jgi:hypothetical protein